jgi:hypothetical protein
MLAVLISKSNKGERSVEEIGNGAASTYSLFMSSNAWVVRSFFFLGIDKEAETPSNCDYQRAMTITNPSHSIKYHLVEIAGTILRRLECVMAMRRERCESKDGKRRSITGSMPSSKWVFACERSV